MTRTARDLLETITAELAPDPRSNPLVPLIASGEADRDVLAVLALEQMWVIPADRRAFLHLALRSTAEPEADAYFTALAQGEAVAQQRLGAFAAACGVDEARASAYTPLPGCQAYPAHVAWLALNAAPADAVLALTANFSAWGGYCATIAGALRTHYGFTDDACGFFDFFAEPAPELDRTAERAVQAALDTGRLDENRARAYGHLLQSYESLFWRTLNRPT
ncbi:transcriptional regulator [Streptomyces sp. 15-116A]|uniref:transcriptional regulator n=1 Tax=Streptomyces sp. 15-116A TaxID=2259035 RepID=UPI0021B1B340|nr:transcriptional regulator [Streptomyces sp. 15-116A]MCT7351967.1 transcriptional regulator [Streptomyces sp. 15-116A]